MIGIRFKDFGGDVLWALRFGLGQRQRAVSWVRLNDGDNRCVGLERRAKLGRNPVRENVVSQENQQHLRIPDDAGQLAQAASSKKTECVDVQKTSATFNHFLQSVLDVCDLVSAVLLRMTEEDVVLAVRWLAQTHDLTVAHKPQRVGLRVSRQIARQRKQRDEENANVRCKQLCCAAKTEASINNTKLFVDNVPRW